MNREILVFKIIFMIIYCAKIVACHHLVCYYRNWSQYSRGKARFLPEDIDPTLCSIIKYAFLRINHVTSKLETIQSNDVEMLGRIRALKKLNPDLKIVIAVGGWGHDKHLPRFSNMVKTRQRRRHFIKSVIKFLITHKLDGLSYNWLYPGLQPLGTPDDKELFAALLKETHDAFKRHPTNCFYSSVTVTSSVRRIEKVYDIDALVKYVDTVDVIFHSLWGPWKKRTGSHSAMKGQQATVVKSLEAWKQARLPLNKTNIGFALYGRTYELKHSSKNQLYVRTNGRGSAGTYTRKEGMLSYYEICARNWQHKTNWETSESGAPFASCDALWVAYDDVSSFAYKIKYLFPKYRLNGLTLWAMDFDDFRGQFCNQGRYPLIRGIMQALSEVQTPLAQPLPAVDIVFLLDSSGSMNQKYQQEKDLVKSLVQWFGINKHGTRASVILFSHYVEHSISLNDFYEIKQFDEALDAIPLMGHTTRIDRALRVAQLLAFTSRKGARKHPPKLLVLLTDGTQTRFGSDIEEPYLIADEIRKLKITILVVGIGKGVNPRELGRIAGGIGNLFIGDSFSESYLEIRLVRGINQILSVKSMCSQTLSFIF